MGKNTNSLCTANNKSKNKKKGSLKKKKRDSVENYIRVGTTYYKAITRKDRFGHYKQELIKWSRQELLVDFNKFELRKIKKYDGFCVIPNNIEHVESSNGFYNLYSRFQHKPEKGSCKAILSFLKHIFGEQYKTGLKYFQALYLHPDRILPILVLVSKNRQTGKTTFIDLVIAIFGNNTVMLNSEMLNSSFNGSYASKNIVAIDEAGLNKNNLDEKLKFISTTKFVLVNEKFVPAYLLEFYGKIIIASNKENSFLNIDSKEIRYFIRRLKKPKKHNSFLIQKMVKEIPAFLHHLIKMPELDWSNSRQLFTAKELRNKSLVAVVEESRSYVYKELEESFIELLSNNNINDEIIYTTPTDIKQRFFENNFKIDRMQIKKALKDEFEFKQNKECYWYTPFGIKDIASKNGRPWAIPKANFIAEQQLKTTNK